MSKVMVTGGAGFIGSHIVDAMLDLGHDVVVFDNLSTGSRDNLAHVSDRIRFHEEDLRDYDAVRAAMEGVEYVSHQGALGSVPRSIDDPQTSHNVNTGGTLNVLLAARDAGVKRVVQAGSSSVYGDSAVSPKHEGLTMAPKSPYALTKVCAVEYGRIFFETYGLEVVSLHYFNIFGPRQSPSGPYAAVIPLFIEALVNGRQATINGDGKHSRDFTYVANAVQANLKGLFHASREACGKVYNIGCGDNISLLQLYEAIARAMKSDLKPVFGPPRAGDVLHSKADIQRARDLLGYAPEVDFDTGIKKTIDWFIPEAGRRTSA